KVECIHGERFSSREIMRATVFNDIECDYNRWRRRRARRRRYSLSFVWTLFTTKPVTMFCIRTVTRS
ncbi:IS3 family transposase, partial [Escherichia coli]